MTRTLHIYLSRPRPCSHASAWAYWKWREKVREKAGHQPVSAKRLGIARTVGQLRKLLKPYPSRTGFGFRNQPMQALWNVKHGKTVSVVFQ